MARHAVQLVEEPIEATALVVDLRNFTPNLNAAPLGAGEDGSFCRFLASYYGACLDTALSVLPPERRDDPPISSSSTGDGVTMVFYDRDHHYLHAYLCALVLQLVLSRRCDEYRTQVAGDVPAVSFGIGVESGRVSRVIADAQVKSQSAAVETFIGHCINVASRAEQVSKTLYRAHTILAAGANELLCADLFGQSYQALVEAAAHPGVAEADRLRIYDQLSDLNRRLYLTFIHDHRLDGVDRPMALFRVSESRTALGNDAFHALLDRLVERIGGAPADVEALMRS